MHLTLTSRHRRIQLPSKHRARPTIQESCVPAELLRSSADDGRAKSCQFYINPAAFVAPPSGEFGNAPHFFSALRLPWYFNENLSASKRFKVYERANMQFQANFFNAFNRVVFSNGGNANTFILNNAPADLSNNSLANSNSVFGIMTDQQNGPRTIQFALKLEF